MNDTGRNLEIESLPKLRINRLAHLGGCIPEKPFADEFLGIAIEGDKGEQSIPELEEHMSAGAHETHRVENRLPN